MITSNSLPSLTARPNNYSRCFNDPIFGKLTINTDIKTNEHSISPSRSEPLLRNFHSSNHLSAIKTITTPPEDSSSFYEQATYFQKLGHELAETNLPQLEPYRIASIKIDFSQSNNKDLGVVNVHRVLDHNTAPGKGGVRFGEEGEVDLSEASGLAKLMTDKNALWNTGMVGAKGVIAVAKGTLPLFEPNIQDTADSRAQKQNYKKQLIKLAFQELFARSLIGPHIDVPAGDMRFGAKEVGHGLQGIKDILQAKTTGDCSSLGLTSDDLRSVNTENAVATITGKPIEEDGLEGREEATGFGVAQVTRELVNSIEGNPSNHPLNGKKVIVQGYGNVGNWSAKHLAKLGATIVGISERPSLGNIYDPNGIDLDALDQHYSAHKTFAGFKGYQTNYADLNTFISENGCPDILVPAAKEGQVNEHVANTLLNLVNQNNMRNFYIIEGANGPVTPKAEAILNQLASKIHIAPGPYANGGGVFVSCQERLKNLGEQDLTRERAFSRLSEQNQQICAKSTDIMQKNELSFFRAVWSLMAQNALQAYAQNVLTSSPQQSTLEKQAA